MLACLGAFAATGALAQDQQRVMTIQSRLTKDGKADDFRKFAETGWKKFAQAAVDEGVYQSAMVIRLTAPSSRAHRPTMRSSPFRPSVLPWPVPIPWWASASPSGPAFPT